MPANGPVIPGDPQHGSQSTGGGAGWRKERGHCTVNIQIRLIIFFAAKMEKLYTVSKNKTGR